MPMISKAADCYTYPAAADLTGGYGVSIELTMEECGAVNYMPWLDMELTGRSGSGEPPGFRFVLSSG
jgi:hypothetical protein